MASKLSQLRRGLPPHKRVPLSDGVSVMVVVVPSDVIRACEEATEQYAHDNPNKVNDNVRNQYFDEQLCHQCMRDPDDPTLSTKVTDSPEEVSQLLDAEDIGRVTSAYHELMMNKAPKLEMLTEEEYESLKKTLEVTPLKDLNTVSLVHLSNFHQVMTSYN